MILIRFLTLLDLTATAPATTQQVDPPFYMSPWFMPAVIILLVFYLMSRTKARAGNKPGEDLLKNLKRGDRIQTIGGVLGVVADVRDDEVTIKVDESSNTRIRFSRDAIRRVIVDQDKTDKTDKSSDSKK